MLSFARISALLSSVSLVLCAVDPTELQQHLSNGVGILGNYSTSGRLTDWMAVLDDSATLQSINIPGTHDSCAWNPPGITRSLLQTQAKAIFDQLNAGIRFFDIRFGAVNSTLYLYHGSQQLDTTATLEDILWGFYHFLDDHPTETIIASLKVDNGNTTADLQSTVKGYTTSSPGSDYWITDATLGTVGAARGKVVLFRRFTYDGSDAFGLNMATGWADNDASFAIQYADGATMYAEDYYELDLGNVTADTVVQTKLAAVEANINSAIASGSNSTQFFVTFASGGGQISSQYVTPETLALGSTSTNANSKTDGVNADLLTYLDQHNGDRMGVVLLDFYDTPTDAVLAIIANSKVTPNATSDDSSSTSSTATSSGHGSTGTGGSDGAFLDAHANLGLVLLSGLLALFSL